MSNHGGGLDKPDIVFFGEPLPAAFHQVAACFAPAYSADCRGAEACAEQVVEG